jgi:hypothetical protein
VGCSVDFLEFESKLHEPEGNHLELKEDGPWDDNARNTGLFLKYCST